MHAARWWPTLLTAGVVVLTLSSTSRADELPKQGAPPTDGYDSPPKAKLERTLYRGLKGAINQGVDLYQAGDHYGCYRLFQGIVLSLKPMLADQPQLQQVLDAGLADAERQPKSWQRAWALRKALDEVRAKLKEGRAGTADQVPTDRVPAVKLPKVEIPPVRVPAPVEPKSKTSLWERLGGQTKIAKMIDDFTTLAAADPKVNFTRNGRIKLNDADVTHFKQEMIDFVSRVTGGPLPYTGKTMKAAHKGMKITSAEFNAAAADLKKVLQDNGVKKTDIDAVLDLVETTRKDIVEVPGGAKAPAGKDDVQKQPATKPGGEPPFEEAKYEGTNSALLDPWGLQDLRGQTVCLTVRAVNPLGDSRRRGVSHEQG